MDTVAEEHKAMIKANLRLKVGDYELQTQYNTIYGIAVYRNVVTNTVYWQFISKFPTDPTVSDESYISIILGE